LLREGRDDLEVDPARNTNRCGFKNTVRPLDRYDPGDSILQTGYGNPDVAFPA